MDHILSQCVFARQVWFLCFARTGIDLTLLPDGNAPLQVWWMRARKIVQKTMRKDFDSFVMLISWCLSKQRNDRVFGRDGITNELGTVECIFTERKLWELASRSGVLHFCE